MQDSTNLVNIRNSNTNIPVILPNGETIKITSNRIILLYKSLSTAAKQIYIYMLPNFSNICLLLIGQLCNDNCGAVFNKHDMLNIKNNAIILNGTRILHMDHGT